MIKKNNNQGFTVLEIGVSLLIISVGMLGVLSLIVQNIRADDVDRNRIIASQLAQEGLELVRNQRDYNWLSEDNWIRDVAEEDSYTIDYQLDTYSGVDDISDPETLLYLNDDGFYVHDDEDNQPSRFRRIIKVEVVDEEAASTTVSSLVQWEDRGSTYQYVAETDLYNWRPRD